MHSEVAKQLIRFAIPGFPTIWADLGAGTGTFTQALMELLNPGSTVFAVDKSPHYLWKVPPVENIKLVIKAADFTHPLPLPLLDGILMANALHYTPQVTNTLINALDALKTGGTLVVIEYDIERPMGPWIPYPIPLRSFQAITEDLGLSNFEIIGNIPSRYGSRKIYSIKANKPGKLTL